MGSKGAVEYLLQKKERWDPIDAVNVVTYELWSRKGKHKPFSQVDVGDFMVPMYLEGDVHWARRTAHHHEIDMPE